VARLLSQASRHLHGVLAQRLGEHGLSEGLHDLLRMVAARESLPQHDIERMLARDHPAPELTMTAVANGWVQRWRAPADRRRYALHLTDDGVRAQQCADAIEREVHSELLAALTPDELAALRGALTKLLNRAAPTGADSTGATVRRNAEQTSPQRSLPGRPRGTHRGPRTPDNPSTRPPTR
jgi:DNA-binding MarR family transcriptional regulator